MIFLKPNRAIIDINMDRELERLAEEISLRKPQVIVIPEWVDVIEVNDIKEKEPVRHGRWMVDLGDRNTGYGGEIVCSECGTGGFSDFWDYCPNCGAKMEKENE